jgi:hypothetical protein
MKRLMRRKVVAIGVVAGLTLGIAGAAVAYFTAVGGGTGTASVGNATGISLVGTITGTLYPAGAPASVSVLVTNTGAGAQHVGSVHLVSIGIDTASATYTGASGAQQALWNACDTTVGTAVPLADPAFSMADIPVNLTLAPLTGNTTVFGSLHMNDTNVSQNNCQGAPLLLTFSSN